MATAGSIVIDLLMKTGAFETDTARAEAIAKKRAQAVERAMSDMAAKVAMGAGMAGTALVAMVGSTTNTAKELSNLAQISGATVTEFQRVAIAAQSVGVQQDQLGDIFKDFREKIGEFVSTGGGEMKDFFEQIAPKVKVTADQFRNLSGPQALQLYFNSLEKAGLSTEQMSFYLEAAGNDATKLIPLLRDGGKELNALGDAAEKTGRIMSDDAVKAAVALAKNMDELAGIFTSIKNQIASEFIPSLTDFSGRFLGIARDVGVAQAAIIMFGSKVAMSLGIDELSKLAKDAHLAQLNVQALGRQLDMAQSLPSWLVDEKTISTLRAKLDAEMRRAAQISEQIKSLTTVGAPQASPTPTLPTASKPWSPPSKPTPASKPTDPGDGLSFAREAAQAWAKAIEQATQMAEEASQQVDNLSQAQSALADIMASPYWAAMSVDMRGMVTTQYQAADAAATNAKSVQALKETRQSETQAMYDTIVSLEQQIEKQQLETFYKKDATTAIEALAIARLKEKVAILEGFDGSQEQVELLRREIAAREDLLNLGLTKKESENDYWANWLSNAEESMLNFDKIAGSAATNFSSGFGNAFEQVVFESQNLGDAISNLTEGMARSVINSLGQMAGQWLAYKAVQLLVGETTQSTGATAMVSNAGAMSLMAGLNAFAATAAIPFVGPLLAPEAMTAALIATAPVVAGITALSAVGARADGGPVSQGLPYLVGERGRELFVPNTHGAIVPNHKLGGGDVTVNLIEDKSRAGQTQERSNNGTRELDVFVADIMGNGPRGQAIQRAFGLNRKGY